MSQIERDKPQDETNRVLKFYSQRAIAIATYFGGPLAAGFLIRQNFINSGKEERGRNALIISVFATLFLFVGLFSIPYDIIEKIPQPLFPIIYTGIIYLIVERVLGQTLKIHKEKNGLFYSNWRAAGIGAICGTILLGGLLMSPDPFDAVRYDKGIADFQKNEEIAIRLFTLIETSETEETLDFIQVTGIPLWVKNINILNELDQIEGLSQELKVQNQVLREYCQLRIQSYQLIQKAISENTNSYDLQIDDYNSRIDDVLTRLQN